MVGTWGQQFQSSYDALVAQSRLQVQDHLHSPDEMRAELSGPLQHALLGPALGQFDSVLDDCESPIEEAMVFALALLALQRADGLELKSPKGFAGELGSTGDHHIVGLLEPQFAVGKYRADFRLECRYRWGYGDRFGAGEVLIECDGHDYHERSKAQAKRDRQRDRELQSDGFKVFRFTGSEIWADPIRCAAEAWDQALTDAHQNGCEKYPKDI